MRVPLAAGPGMRRAVCCPTWAHPCPALSAGRERSPCRRGPGNRFALVPRCHQPRQPRRRRPPSARARAPPARRPGPGCPACCGTGQLVGARPRVAPPGAASIRATLDTEPASAADPGSARRVSVPCSGSNRHRARRACACRAGAAICGTGNRRAWNGLGRPYAGGLCGKKQGQQGRPACTAGGAAAFGGARASAGLAPRPCINRSDESAPTSTTALPSSIFHQRRQQRRFHPSCMFEKKRERNESGER